MSSPTHAPALTDPPGPVVSGLPRATPAEIDASCRWPVGFLFVCAVAWLLGAGALAVLASIKLHAPGFLAQYSWLTYGRVQPAAWNAFAFGFATQAGLGVALWMTCRLGGAPLAGGVGVLIATWFWNVGLKLGLWGILAGGSTGFETLELPGFAALILFCTYLAIASWAIVAFQRRRERTVYVSQWYVLGALFSFPWLYAAACLVTVVFPVRGVLQAAAQAWFTHGLLVFWFGFLGLAALLYFIPKLTGRAIPSRSLALFGFWSLALFGGFGGLQRYAGGPFPAYLLSASVVASVLTVCPVLAVALNLAPALRGARVPARDQAVLRFFSVAFVACILAGWLGALNALPPVRRTTQFTLFTVGLDQLTLWGFFGMAMLGAVYFIVPRLLGRDWPSAALVRFHFICAVAGTGLMVGAFLTGGLVQGGAMNDPSLPFFLVMKRYLPFASMGTLANLVLLAGNVALGVNLARLLVARGAAYCVPAARALVRPEGVAAEAKA